MPCTPGRPTSSSPSTRDAVDRPTAAARARSVAASVRSSSRWPWTASWRRLASSEISSSELGDVERTIRTARSSVSTSISESRATWSIALWVSEPAILCVDVSTASAPSFSAVSRDPRVEAEVRPPRLVDEQRHAGVVGDLRQRRDVGADAVVGRRDDERRARVGRLGEPRRAASRARRRGPCRGRRRPPARRTPGCRPTARARRRSTRASCAGR